MTAKEIKNIDKEISRLCSKRARLESAVENTSPKLTGMPPAGGASDKVGAAVAQLADINNDIQKLRKRKESELERLDRDKFIENCLYLRLALRCSWAKIAVKTGGINSPDNIRMMCKKYEW